MSPEVWLRVAGFGTWLVASLVTGADILRGQVPWSQAGPWLAAFGSFGAAFGAMCWLTWRPAWTQYGLLAVQTAAALVMAWAGRDALAAATLVVVAGQLPALVSPRVSTLWVLAQTGLLAVVLGQFFSFLSTLSVSAAFGGFQIFAVAMARLAARERSSREALAVVNVELEAARSLVAEQSRAAERLRISRDLHDALGHHLTALSLQLDVASRLADGRAADHVQQAHAIARLLLADVRSVVSQLRESSAVDVAEALRRLIPASGPLAVHLDMMPALSGVDPDRAQVLVRCVQEVITNAVRHAGAANLWITIADTADGIRVDARDDGQGAAALDWGNGLRGMRERFESCEGRLDVRTRPGGGFELHGVMPRAGTA
jgi:signal transduction histidine kinase